MRKYPKLSYLQAVGEWHDSAIVNITGELGVASLGVASYMLKGAFHSPIGYTSFGFTTGGDTNAVGAIFSASKVVKTAADNRTRAYATLGCVCVGPTQTQPSVP